MAGVAPGREHRDRDALVGEVCEHGAAGSVVPPQLVPPWTAAVQAEPIRAVAIVGACQPGGPVDILHGGHRRTGEQLAIEDGPPEAGEVVGRGDDDTTVQVCIGTAA